MKSMRVEMNETKSESIPVRYVRMLRAVSVDLKEREVALAAYLEIAVNRIEVIDDPDGIFTVLGTQKVYLVAPAQFAGLKLLTKQGVYYIHEMIVV